MTDADPAGPPAASGPAARWFSKPVIDPLNTVAWFAMDACWLCRLTWPAYLAAGLTVATGLLLSALGRREGRGAVYADLGLNCWIGMNTIWLLHDLNGRETPRAVAAVLGGLGAVFVVAAARHSQEVRRVRVSR